MSLRGRAGNRQVVVVGGGIAGLTAGGRLDRAGLDVTFIAARVGREAGRA